MLLAEGRALKKRWFTLYSSSSSARMAAEPAHSANDLLWSWLEKPFGSVVVVPITVRRERVDWCKEVLLGDRGGLRPGELEGVMRREEPGPAFLLLTVNEPLAIPFKGRIQTANIHVPARVLESPGCICRDAGITCQSYVVLSTEPSS